MKEAGTISKIGLVQKILLNYEKYLVSLGWGIFAAIGLLQMFKVKGGFVASYGADIIAPAMLYHSTRSRKTILSKIIKKGPNEIQTFILIWSLCIIWETLQEFDLSGTPLAITRGTFDTRDKLAYTLTLVVCYYLDKSLADLHRKS
jgi:hypothetical protein